MDDEAIFLRAVEITDPAERVAFLDETCGDDPSVRGSVESLLRYHELPRGFLEEPLVDAMQTIEFDALETRLSGPTNGALEFLETCDDPEYVGQLGSYRIIEVIGAGGMGVVLRAHDPKLKRVVAIKVLAAEPRSNPAAVERFLREAQAAAAVHHDHIVTIHSVEDGVARPYLVMECVEGISLQQKIDGEGALALDEIVRIGSQLARGLEAAHAGGLVHRDIKPANILLEAATQRVKITDFGLAYAMDAPQRSQERLIVGTPQYMSPEQALGHRTDHRSDLFSLGGVLYAMCTGRPPFTAETALAALRGVCDDRPTPVRELNPQIPQWLERLIDRLLGKDPDQRPQSAEEVERELSAAHDQRVKKGSNTAWPMIATISAVCMAMLGVIIVIKRDGASTRLNVPAGSEVNVDRDGNVEVRVPDKVPSERTPKEAGGKQEAAAAFRSPPPLPGFDDATPTRILTSDKLGWTDPVDVGVGDINWGLHVSADGLTLLYGGLLSGGLGDVDLWMRRRKTVNEQWSPPVNLGPPVNTKFRESAPCLSSDGLTLVFESHRAGGGSAAADLWMSQRDGVDQPWSEPVNLGDEINAIGWQRCPFLSADGLTLYFMTNDGRNANRIYLATRQSAKDAWSSPKPVEFPGADEAWAFTPAVSSDGLTLYFAANRESQLRYCTRGSTTAAWSAPQNVGPPLGSLRSVTFPNFSRDGRTLTFMLGGRVSVTHRILKGSESRE